jgi:sirohydrochlorin ferrochelatase
MTSKHYMVRRGVPGSLTLLREPFESSPLPSILSPLGWEPAILGVIVHTAYRCPVNLSHRPEPNFKQLASSSESK